MKKPGFPMMGIALYVIVTIIDVFFISLPMSMYIVALVMGSALIMTAFFEEPPHFDMFFHRGSRHTHGSR